MKVENIPHEAVAKLGKSVVIILGLAGYNVSPETEGSVVILISSLLYAGFALYEAYYKFKQGQANSNSQP